MSRQIYLSKSKLISGWQCEKRLWLEKHKPELVEISPSTQAAIAFRHFSKVLTQALCIRAHNTPDSDKALLLSKLGISSVIVCLKLEAQQQLPISLCLWGFGIGSGMQKRILAKGKMRRFSYACGE
ncbi:MAG: hypothetical protein P8M73_11755 [Luminiphilus sp.]|nr:hypothetical protein [Luminiphilus sp.]